MTTKLIEKKDNMVTFEWSFPWEQFEQYEKKAYLRTRNRYRIDGFRKGKAPMHMIENFYGKGVFYEDALNIAIDDQYETLVRELDIQAIGHPKADVKTFEEGKDVVIEFETEVYPEFEIEEIECIEIPLIEEEVSDEMVDAQIDMERRKNARRIDVDDRAVESGDIVMIDFIGKLDGEPFEGGAAEDTELVIGSGQFIPGFEDQIIGKSRGDAFDICVTFPDEYHAEHLAGKEVIFETVLNEIMREELPEADDDFAAEVSEFDTLDAYRADLREKLEASLKEHIAIREENALVDALVKKAGIQAPEAMVRPGIGDEKRALEEHLRRQGLTLEQYKEYTGLTDELIEEQVKKRAQEKATINLVLAQAAKQIGLEVTDEDREKAIKDAAVGFGMEPDKFFEMAKSHDIRFMDTGILNAKTVRHLMGKVKRVAGESPKDKPTKAKKTTSKSKEKEDSAKEGASDQPKSNEKDATSAKPAKKAAKSSAKSSKKAETDEAKEEKKKEPTKKKTTAKKPAAKKAKDEHRGEEA